MCTQSRFSDKRRDRKWSDDLNQLSACDLIGHIVCTRRYSKVCSVTLTTTIGRYNFCFCVLIKLLFGTRVNANHYILFYFLIWKIVCFNHFLVSVKNMPTNSHLLYNKNTSSRSHQKHIVRSSNRWQLVLIMCLSHH